MDSPGEAPDDSATLQDDAPNAEKQFSLRGLFLLVTFCAVLSWPMSHLPRPVFAGVLGGLTVLLMLLQAFFEPRHAMFLYGWWALLGFYLLACGMAAAGW